MGLGDRFKASHRLRRCAWAPTGVLILFVGSLLLVRFFEQLQRQQVGLGAPVQGLILSVVIEVGVGFISEFTHPGPGVGSIAGIAVHLPRTHNRAAAAAA